MAGVEPVETALDPEAEAEANDEDMGENKDEGKGADDTGVLSPYSGSPPPVLPPANVQSWLRKEDWEALTKAWEDAEAKAIAWAEGADAEEGFEVWEDVESPPQRASISSLPPLTSKRRRPKWDEAFHLLGQDSRRPPPLRRYFDPVCSETSLPRALRGEEQRKFDYEQRNFGVGSQSRKAPARRSLGASPESSVSMQTRRPWAASHHLDCSVDNDTLHPHLRHYFDRRGLEASYRTRPNVNKVTPSLRPRTPNRPSTREKILKFRSSSEPNMLKGAIPGAERHVGNMHWGTRCLMYGPEPKAKPKPSGPKTTSERIPWISDHHTSVAEDNSILNPMLRHYFDADGLESSYRNRGMHYGRKPRSIWGSIPVPSKPAGASGGRSSTASSVGSSLFEGSISSSLLDELDFWVNEEGQSGENSEAGKSDMIEAGGLRLDAQALDTLALEAPAPDALATDAQALDALAFDAPVVVEPGPA